MDASAPDLAQCSRYLWTDAFGVTLLVSLFHHSRDERYLAQAEWVVAEVYRVLGRPRGIRIGEAADRDGQYFHYLAKWIYALTCLAEIKPSYRQRAVGMVKQIHTRFVVPGVGVHWKMSEDLRQPYPGYGFGALDAFDGCVVYRLLDPVALAAEIAEMEGLVERSWRDLVVTQDLGLGMMLWMTQFFPGEAWARHHRALALRILDRMWVDPPGYFCREPGRRDLKFAFTNYGVVVGLEAVDAWPERVDDVLRFFETYRSGDTYDTDAITHVMGCSARMPGRLIGHSAR